MSIEGDLYSAIRTAYAADTGAGGLALSSSTAYVASNDFFREDDPDWHDNKNWPAIMVSIPSIPESDAFSRGRATAYGRFHLVVRRNTGQLTNLDAILSRLRTVFHRTAFSASTDWQWSPLLLRTQQRGPSNKDEMTRFIDFSTVATRVTGVA